MKANDALEMDQKWVDSVVADGIYRVYTDTKTIGLQLVVNAGGKISWRLKFWFKDAPVTKKLGERRSPLTKKGMTLKEARIRCDSLRTEIQRTGVVPSKKNKGETLDDLYQLLEAHHFPALSEGTRRNYKMSYRLYVKDQFGSLPPDKITKADVVKHRTHIQKTHGVSCANKLLMIFNLIFNVCRENGFCSIESPVAGTKRTKTNHDERDRYLNREEREVFLREVEGLADREFAGFLKLLLFTGQRSNNVVRMKWSQLNLDSRQWIIPADEMKSRKVHVVSLSQTAIDTIRRFPMDRTYVLHSHPDWDKRLNSWQKKWNDWRGEIGFGPSLDDPDNQVNLHDLRRSFGAILAQQQYSLHTIAKALGQTSISSTSIYARLNEAAMVDACGVVEDVLLGRDTGRRVLEQ